MMIAPVHKLNKAEIVWLSRHKCKKHRHSYLSHYECFLKEEHEGKRTCYLDIETSNLDANIGVILCWCIKDANADVVKTGVVNKYDILSDTKDRNVVKSLLDALEDYDEVITYYGARFDIPFIRTRSLINDLKFPEYDQKKHIDAYFTVKHKLKLSRNSLDVCCRDVLGKSDKTHLLPKVWLNAVQGNKKALEYIVDHCVKDVYMLEKLWKRINGFRRQYSASM